MLFALSVVVGGCSSQSNGVHDPIEDALSAANSEANSVKTAAIAFCADRGVWPETSSNLTGTYIVGTLKAVYDIDDDYGWLLSATNSTWPDAITFLPGVPGPDGQDGCWVRR